MNIKLRGICCKRIFAWFVFLLFIRFLIDRLRGGYSIILGKSTIDYYSFDISDWLINYESGFIRRGIMGQILWEIEQLHLYDVRIAITLISLFVVMEVLLMVGLPRMMMARQSMWERARNREDMMLKLENMRRKARRIHAASPFMQAVLEEIGQDLDKRVEYVRENELLIRDRGRRSMMDDLVRIEAVLDKLANSADFSKGWNPDVDSSLKAVIGNAKE